MEEKKCGKIHCANCEKIIGFFPLDNEAIEQLEVYCEICLPEIEESSIPVNVTYLRVRVV